MPVLVERPEITSFINAWQSKPKEQVIEELASYSLETKRIPDPYHFVVATNGELFSPTAHCKIKDTVEDRTSHLGYLEYQAVRSIEQWVASSSEGAVAWVSPPYPGVYPTSKIIISEIEYQNGNKRLFNRAIVLDFDEKKCLEFVQQLVQYSQDRPMLTHLDQIRSTPIILNTRGLSWVNILQELIDDPVLWESVRNGEDLRAKKETLRQAAMVQKDFFSISGLSHPDEIQKAVLQMLGPRTGSCPPRASVQNRTAFQVFVENAVTYGGLTIKDPDFCKVCPICEKEINCVVKAGGSCPKCGAIKRCG